jgi:hemin uptake protein HemP
MCPSVNDNRPISDKAEREPATHDVMALMAGGSMARLIHRGEVYVLRITRLGKLILTK